MWESTLRCNAFCEFCGSSCNAQAASDELSSAEIRGLFQRIAERYDASDIMINVTGGEPLLRRDLFDVMEYAHSRGYRWGIVTNGSLLTDANIEGLRRSCVSTISVSIDGMGELHDQIRRFPGCFDRIVEGLQKLKRLDTLEHCMVTTIVSRHNYDQLEPLKHFLCSLPIDIWRTGTVDPIRRAHENDALLLDPEQMQGVLSFVRRSRQEALPYRVTTSCSHYLGEYELTARDAPFQCFSGKQLAGIPANGDIFVCPNVPRRPELIQGNIRTDDFIKVWENGFQYFRDLESRKKNRCETCSHFPVCAGDSLHTWDFDRDAPRICFLDYGMKPQNFPHSVLREKSFDEIIDICRTGRENCRCLRVKAQSLSKDRVILSAQAAAAVFSFFGWGDKRSEPATEQIAAYTGPAANHTELLMIMPTE